MSELQQSIVSKVNCANCTYLGTANYWALLEYEEEDNECESTSLQKAEITNITDKEVQSDLRSLIHGWLNQRVSKRKPFQCSASTMVINLGATSSFVWPEENLPIMGSSCKVVRLPDRSSIQATHTTILSFESLSAKAWKADVLPGLQPNSLVSVGKFSNVGYTTVFHLHGEGVTVHKKNTFHLQAFCKPVLQGWQDANGLWWASCDQKKPIGVSPSNMEVAATAYNLPSIAQMIWYLHAAAGFPAKDTWIKAINSGNYKTWPGITAKAVCKHFPESIETQKEHMKKQWQNVRSTKQKAVLDTATTETNELTQALAKQSIIVKVVNVDTMVYTDQTGWFPVQSNRGNTSVMVYYDVDANFIDAEPQKIASCSWYHWILTEGTWQKEQFKHSKSHFISILARVDTAFLMNLWDRLLPHAVMTLNQLQQANKTPTITAYQYVNGPFDYIATPLPLLGCKGQFHESTSRWQTWDPLALPGWYLVTST